ncbi:MAG: rhamnulokinase [Chloroflexi bacterium]|nr:rhamnulokinase [Chloroflexota bacterium]
MIVAVDIGASSGRVIAGRLVDRRLELEEIHRFPNDPVIHADGLHWDAHGLFDNVVDGLRRVAHLGESVLSIGIDTWGCDVGWLGADGALLAQPFHHRDVRNEAAARLVHEAISPADLYARTGLQYLPFNTIYQVVAARQDPWAAEARTMLLMPDLIGYWLTGQAVAERTNASTTALLDPRTRDWDHGLLLVLGIEQRLLPPLRDPGTLLGSLKPSIASATGLDASTPVTLVGSHDTASAVAAVPADSDDVAFVSCGTWSLVGLELTTPILTEPSRRGSFTNEGGVDGTTRYLHNVMGLWLLAESLRAWGAKSGLAGLLAAASALPDGGPTFDADDSRFLAPGDMPARIIDACAATGQPLSADQPSVVRAILDSLAESYGRTLRAAQDLTGQQPAVVNLVGGGSRNELLCRLAADAIRRPVVAGPVEATAIGNLLVQARSIGLIDGGLTALRRIVRENQPLKRYEPRARVDASADFVSPG